MKAGPRAEEIRQARAELAAAEADLEIVREEYERVARLFGMSTSSRAEYDTALFAYNRARGRAESARARFDMDLAGSRPQQIAQAAAELARAEANLDLLRAGTRPEDLAAAAATAEELRDQVREIEANLRERAVGALDRAVVEVLAVRPGDLVAPNAPVARILRARDLWVKVYVPETELGKVRLNQPAEVTVDAYPGRRLAGRVRQIASIAEFTPRNVQSLEGRRSQVFGVKVYVRDPEGIFKSGMAAEVSLPLAPSRGSDRR